MSLVSHFQLLAEYNRWMNASVYRVAAELPADALGRDRGAYFGSIIGTLNHILVGDLIWLHRFSGHPMPLRSLDVMRSRPAPGSLDKVLYPEFGGLRAAREGLDEVILGFTAEAGEAHYRTGLTYRNMSGVESERRFGFLVQHFFNHQTHHRGQVSTLLSQRGLDVGVTDLLALIPDMGG